MLILWANCASHSVSKFPATPTLNTSTPENSTAVSQGNSSETSNEVMSEKEVPATFKGIDFKHLSYPTSFRKKYIPLHDGTYEIPGGTGGDTFELEGVDYVDITGDGKKDASCSFSGYRVAFRATAVPICFMSIRYYEVN